MATVTGLTATRMAEIEAQCIINGAVDLSGHLQLTTHGGDVIDAGLVKGADGINGAKGDKGDKGDTGAAGTNGTNGTNAPTPLVYIAHSGAVTNITNATFTKMGGWAFTSGTTSMFTIGNTGNVDFTAAASGLYDILFSATFNTSAAGRRIVAIYVNGTEWRRVDQPSAAVWTGEVSRKMLLTAGDVVNFEIYQSSGGALALLNTPGHEVNIVKLA